MTKKQVKEECIRHLSDKIKDLKEAINDVQGSANEETKSSAGDKHETARAMAQNETDRLTGQLNAQKQLLAFVSSINVDDQKEVAESGALVTTDKGTFFLSAGIGKISVDGHSLMAISVNTPFGQALTGKKKGETITVNGNDFSLINIE